MCQWLRKRILGSQLSIKKKTRWTKDKKELVQLLEGYLPLDQTTFSEAESFVRSLGPSAQSSTSTPESDPQFALYHISENIDTILWFGLRGPSLRDPSLLERIIPFRSVYTVKLQFRNNRLVAIDASLVRFHL
jgi:hypothetical protein